MAGFIQNTSVHGSAQGIEVVARLDRSTDQGPSSTCLAVDITIDPELHVYGLPVPEGFIPLSIDVVSPPESVHVGALVFPPPKPHQMEGFDESFFIYEGRLTALIPLTIHTTGDSAVLDVQIRYQACGDRGCFMPQTVELSLPMRV